MNLEIDVVKKRQVVYYGMSARSRHVNGQDLILKVHEISGLWVERKACGEKKLRPVVLGDPERQLHDMEPNNLKP